MKKIEKLPVTPNDKPRQRVQVFKCGQLIKKAELDKKREDKVEVVE